MIRVNVHNSLWRIPDLFKRGLVNKHHYQRLQHWTEPRVFTFSLANRSHHGHPDPYSLALATATFRRGDPIHPSIGRKEGRSFDVDAAAACGLACSRWAEGRVGEISFPFHGAVADLALDGNGGILRFLICLYAARSFSSSPGKTRATGTSPP